MDDRAGEIPVEHPGDATQAQPTADAEGQVTDERLVEVLAQPIEEGVVTGGHVAFESLGELDGQSFGRRIRRMGRPLGDVEILVLGQLVPG